MVAKIEEEKEYQAEQKREKSREEEIVLEPVNIYQAEIEDFTRCILEDKKPSFTPEEGLHNLKVILACYQSAKRGTTIHVE